MNNVLLALMFSAGVAGLVYSQIGKRVGYGNSGNVWTLVAIAFAMSFVVLIIILNVL